jgi:hypothetical protein
MHHDSFAGCLFDYRLIPPAALMGLEFPFGQPTDQVTGVFNGDINGVHSNATPGYSTPAGIEWMAGGNQCRLTQAQPIDRIARERARLRGLVPPTFSCAPDQAGWVTASA